MIGCYYTRVTKFSMYLGYYTYLKEDIRDAVRGYGSLLMADRLYILGILNPSHYVVLQRLKNTSNMFRASVLAELLLHEMRKTKVASDFKKFLKDEPSLKYLYYLINGAGQ